MLQNFTSLSLITTPVFSLLSFSHVSYVTVTFAQPKINHAISVVGYCVYKGVYYTQGQAWDDGCDYRCRCEDVMKGYYTCNQRSVPLNIKPAPSIYFFICHITFSVGTSLDPSRQQNTTVQIFLLALSLISIFFPVFSLVFHDIKRYLTYVPLIKFRIVYL